MTTRPPTTVIGSPVPAESVIVMISISMGEVSPFWPMASKVIFAIGISPLTPAREVTLKRTTLDAKFGLH